MMIRLTGLGRCSGPRFAEMGSVFGGKGVGLVLAGLTALAGLLFWGMAGRQTSAQAAACWQAAITEQWTDTDLVGSVLRVSVEGKAGLPVWVRSRGGFETYNYTGTKPEYGPYVAEYAPLSRGTYFIEPQGLGIEFEIWLDGKSYTRVDFTPLPCAPTATPTQRPAAAPTRAPAATPTQRAEAPAAPPPTQPPQPVAGWQGRVVEHIRGLEGRYHATIAVRVIGRPAGQEVEIRSNGWSETCKTGTKPEHGPDACEFGALNAGTYRLTPKDLGTALDVTVGLQDFVMVEFYYTGPAPQTRWVGSVVENTSGEQPTEHVNSAIAVAVAGRPWHEVEIRSNGWTSACTTGYKPEYGPDACEFGALRAGTYTITPKDLGTSVQVTVDGWGWAMVRFEEVAAPAPLPTRPSAAAQPTTAPARPAAPTPTRETASPGPTPSPSPTPAGPLWDGWVVSNTSGEQEGTGIWSVIVVRVLNWGDVPVHITGGGGWSATCTTGTKPEYGSDACEFGGLWPGTYYLQPEGADAVVEVEMDGLGIAFVEFAAP
jgi:hypothetical protein